MFSFLKMFWTWILTVLSARSSLRAISLLLSPCASEARMSRSRGEKRSRSTAPVSALGGLRTPWISLAVICCETTDSPCAARRMASTNASVSIFLSR
jgi:hypothetical protein